MSLLASAQAQKDVRRNVRLAERAAAKAARVEGAAAEAASAALSPAASEATAELRRARAFCVRNCPSKPACVAMSGGVVVGGGSDGSVSLATQS